jgi:hypothetical protein
MRLEIAEEVMMLLDATLKCQAWDALYTRGLKLRYHSSVSAEYVDPIQLNMIAISRIPQTIKNLHYYCRLIEGCSVGEEAAYASLPRYWT